MQYYLYINNTSVGPMSESQILSYKVDQNTPVSTDGVNWQPLYSYPELMQLLNSGVSPASSRKVVAGILAILLGSLGVQYFYIGKVAGGFITILLSLVTCGCWSVVTLIQGILMLTMSDTDFERKYINSTGMFPLF